MQFIPLSLEFKAAIGSSSLKSAYFKSSGDDGFLFTGFETVPGLPYTYTTPVSKHIHPAASYEAGVSYYISTSGKVVPSTDPDATNLFYGVGNVDGGIDLDIRIIAEQTAILTMNATCVASPPTDVETQAGTITMNATCVASPPIDA